VYTAEGSSHVPTDFSVHTSGLWGWAGGGRERGAHSRREGRRSGGGGVGGGIRVKLIKGKARS
jgi:hypothetical protein